MKAFSLFAERLAVVRLIASNQNYSNCQSFKSYYFINQWKRETKLCLNFDVKKGLQAKSNSEKRGKNQAVKFCQLQQNAALQKNSRKWVEFWAKRTEQKIIFSAVSRNFFEQRQRMPQMSESVKTRWGRSGFDVTLEKFGFRRNPWKVC